MAKDISASLYPKAALLQFNRNQQRKFEEQNHLLGGMNSSDSFLLENHHEDEEKFASKRSDSEGKSEEEKSEERESEDDELSFDYLFEDDEKSNRLVSNKRLKRTSSFSELQKQLISPEQDHQEHQLQSSSQSWTGKTGNIQIGRRQETGFRGNYLQKLGIIPKPGNGKS